MNANIAVCNRARPRSFLCTLLRFRRRRRGPGRGQESGTPDLLNAGDKCAKKRSRDTLTAIDSPVISESASTVRVDGPTASVPRRAAAAAAGAPEAAAAAAGGRRGVDDDLAALQVVPEGILSLCLSLSLSLSHTHTFSLCLCVSLSVWLSLSLSLSLSLFLSLSISPYITLSVSAVSLPPSLSRERGVEDDLAAL
jgi:hypothetical protein